MTDLDLTWSDVRDNISSQFGEVPGPILENEIINAFQKNPAAVIKAAEEVAAALRAGEIHSGWPILRKRTERITNPLRNVTIPRPDARAKAITRAEQWMKTAGIHCDRASEVELDMFGNIVVAEHHFTGKAKPPDDNRGALSEWRDDTALRSRFLDLWREARPIGEQLEQDLHDRSEHWKQTTGVLLTDRNRRRLQQQADPSTNTELITDTIPNSDLPAELQETTWT